ncbi:retroviral aspartyl protease [Clostridium homopropionicum DSM 5847]|uniref:Retroviral aspartyl protease n=1 Tax=Clostridium homopropionicum DSM 5847 TaxID=1121318 RepID=A0A0L6Z708_9CLOT|nr:retropepsin-like aspartic protease [Clostridium homopropionicum]KOA18745.1 retroviral aspartyl protease [Clostridium homopropionicum DSM 5847]SFG54617.1 Aspartyl protease [Clostridium homopropionicum]
MKIAFKNELLHTSLEIIYKGKTKIVNDMIIDTGASHTIISPDAVIELDVEPEGQDEFVTMYGIGGEQYAYRKSIEGIKMCNHELKDIKIDFGLVDDYGKINGLLGLDILLNLNVNIDLKNFTLSIQ